MYNSNFFWVPIFLHQKLFTAKAVFFFHFNCVFIETTAFWFPLQTQLCTHTHTHTHTHSRWLRKDNSQRNYSPLTLFCLEPNLSPQQPWIPPAAPSQTPAQHTTQAYSRAPWTIHAHTQQSLACSTTKRTHSSVILWAQSFEPIQCTCMCILSGMWYLLLIHCTFEVHIISISLHKINTCRCTRVF